MPIFPALKAEVKKSMYSEDIEPPTKIAYSVISANPESGPGQAPESRIA
jgi:hypothetical protein